MSSKKTSRNRPINIKNNLVVARGKGRGLDNVGEGRGRSGLQLKNEWVTGIEGAAQG